MNSRLRSPGRALLFLCLSLAIIALGWGGLTVTPVWADTEVRLQSTLTPTAAGRAARGTAEWRQQRDDNGALKRTRFEVVVQDVPTNGAGRVTVVRNGATVFAAAIQIVDNDGRLRLDTDNGQQVPTLQGGDRVEVRDRTGVLVLTGTLRRV
jgi:exoribonuclease II